MNGQSSPRFHEDVESAISFIAMQLGGPRRVLSHHVKMPNGLCGACSSVSPVRWPCPIVSMAMHAEAMQVRASQARTGRAE